jgi:hypothetical protein
VATSIDADIKKTVSAIFIFFGSTGIVQIKLQRIV